MSKQRIWDVKLWFRDGRGVCEAGANSSWPAEWGPMQVIADVAKWRRVDLEACHEVEAKCLGDEY